MPISRDLLGPDEEVLVDLHPHWLFLFGPSALTLAALVATFTIIAEFPNAPSIVSYLLAAMVVIPAIWFATRFAQWLSISLVVTNTRLLLRRGLFGRNMTQLRLSRISEIHYNQSLPERLVGTGRLLIDVQGEDGAVVIDDIRNPRALQRVITNQLGQADGIDGYGSGSAGPRADAERWDRGRSERPSYSATPPRGVARPSTSGGGSLADQLIELDELRRRGILTEWEFQAKKAEILNRR